MDFDENMALRYTLLDDEDLGIDYEDNLTTAVAVREELLANNVGSDILEATSMAMRTLLTSFGEYSIRPADCSCYLKLGYQRAGLWEYLSRDWVTKFQFFLPFGTIKSK